MECLYCQGEMEKAEVSYTVNHKDFHLLIRNIPAYVCTRCGEKYYEDREVEVIQNLIKNLEAEIEDIRNYEKIT